MGKLSITNQMLTGFWEADKSFSREAGLSVFSFYLGDPDVYGHRPCYILVVDDEETIIMNEPTTGALSQQWGSLQNWNIFNDLNPKEYDLKFKKLESDFFPSTMCLSYYPTTGKIILYNKETVYAVLYKNPVLSEISVIKKLKSLTPEPNIECPSDSEEETL